MGLASLWFPSEATVGSRICYFEMVLNCVDDHRLFCGDLGNEVNDEVLTKAFSRFITFNMARVSTLILYIYF